MQYPNLFLQQNPVHQQQSCTTWLAYPPPVDTVSVVCNFTACCDKKRVKRMGKICFFFGQVEYFLQHHKTLTGNFGIQYMNKGIQNCSKYSLLKIR